MVHEVLVIFLTDRKKCSFFLVVQGVLPPSFFMCVFPNERALVVKNPQTGKDNPEGGRNGRTEYNIEALTLPKSGFNHN